MRGLDRLLQIRRQGLRPSSAVHLMTDPAAYAYEGWVVCDVGDTPADIDLRPLYDLVVMVSGNDFNTVNAWARAAAAAGAKSVVALVSPSESMPSFEDAAILKHNGEMLA